MRPLTGTDARSASRVEGPAWRTRLHCRPPVRRPGVRSARSRSTCRASATCSAELQVAADAGAHAGAVQYIHDPAEHRRKSSTPRASYAQRNTAMGVVPTIDIAEMGVWDPVTSTFTPGLPNPNAVRVQVSVASVGLHHEIVGVGPPVVHASAIGSTATFPTLPPPTARPVLVK